MRLREALDARALEVQNALMERERSEQGSALVKLMMCEERRQSKERVKELESRVESLQEGLAEATRVVEIEREKYAEDRKRTSSLQDEKLPSDDADMRTRGDGEREWGRRQAQDRRKMLVLQQEKEEVLRELLEVHGLNKRKQEQTDGFKEIEKDWYEVLQDATDTRRVRVGVEGKLERLCGEIRGGTSAREDCQTAVRDREERLGRVKDTREDSRAAHERLQRAMKGDDECKEKLACRSRMDTQKYSQLTSALAEDADIKRGNTADCRDGKNLMPNFAAHGVDERISRADTVHRYLETDRVDGRAPRADVLHRYLDKDRVDAIRGTVARATSSGRTERVVTEVDREWTVIRRTPNRVRATEKDFLVSMGVLGKVLFGQGRRGWEGLAKEQDSLEGIAETGTADPQIRSERGPHRHVADTGYGKRGCEDDVFDRRSRSERSQHVFATEKDFLAGIKGKGVPDQGRRSEGEIQKLLMKAKEMADLGKRALDMSL